MTDRKFKVLIIEDEPDLIDLHEESLREMGCVPIVAPLDLEAMKPMVEDCDFILSEIVPSVGEDPASSYDIIFDLASRNHKEVILCSRHFQDELKMTGYHYYVSKPVRFEELSAAVETCKNNVIERERQSQLD